MSVEVEEEKMETEKESSLQALENFYSEQKCPTEMALQELAAVMDLPFKQVQQWFVEKRRRDKVVPPCLSKKISVVRGENELGAVHPLRKLLPKDAFICDGAKYISGHELSTMENRIGMATSEKKPRIVQDLMNPRYIFGKVFRKDGPPLGVEFDSLPTRAFQKCEGILDSSNSSLGSLTNQRARKRRKVSKQGISGCQDLDYSAPAKKHGMGKGLMTVWRAVNPNSGTLPSGIHCADNEAVPRVPQKPKRQSQRRQQRQLASVIKQKKLENKFHNKRKPSIKRTELVESKRTDPQKQPRKGKCELALEGAVSLERMKQFTTLSDDEELELRELQAGPNPFTCSDHCSTNILHGCSLCKDLLPKFPPNNVKMKQPFTDQPWESCPETVKKLFKVFHFLYTYSVTIDICHFTLDEFAQAFHDKDSSLLGKIHVALLKLLFTDVETEINSGYLPQLSTSCKFLALLHTVEDHEFILEFWRRSLNPLTWTDILHQVLVAAGFGSKQGASRKKSLSKDMSLMVKNGLCPRTLKGELLTVLSERGINGCKVADLAKSPKIVELNLASSSKDLELQINSTLSSDITLFEKIGPSAYRLRIMLSKADDDYQSDTEGSGSVHDGVNDSGICSSSDSEFDSENSSAKKNENICGHRTKLNMRTVRNEIDESHPGEVWLLGLVEGEYSDLSIDEKLNALVALTDLLGASSSFRMEDARSPVESVSSTLHHGSGGKIKRSSSKQQNLPRPSWIHNGQTNDTKAMYISSASLPIDSSVSIKKSREKSFGEEIETIEAEFGIYSHPMQSIFLGSDRRYNRYWLFLGPCDLHDPGHRRVYFESSEDGHWEVIDTEEALHTLISVLDDRGTREAFLIESLEKREAFLCQEMSSCIRNGAEDRQFSQVNHSELEIVREKSTSPVSDVDNNLSLTDITNNSSTHGAIVLELGKREEEENRKWIRLQEFDAWIWNYFYCNLNSVKHCKRSYFESLTRCETCHDLYWRDEKHCRFCHTTFELDFDLEERYTVHAATCVNKAGNKMFQKHNVLSSQQQSLKAAVHAIELAMPEDALLGAWTKSAHRLWVKRLRRTSSLAELLQVITDFVAAINEDWLDQHNVGQGSNISMEEIVADFSTISRTSSALALWLVKLDNFLSPFLKRIDL